jgi:hypothetical protein
VRRGEVVAHGWKLGGRAFKNMMKSPRAPAANDNSPSTSLVFKTLREIADDPHGFILRQGYRLFRFLL